MGAGVFDRPQPWDSINYDPYEINMVVVNDDDHNTLLTHYSLIGSTKINCKQLRMHTV